MLINHAFKVSMGKGVEDNKECSFISKIFPEL